MHKTQSNGKIGRAESHEGLKWKRSRRGRERFHRRKRIPIGFPKTGKERGWEEERVPNQPTSNVNPTWTLNASSNVFSFDSARPFIQTKNRTLCKSSFPFNTQTTSNSTWNGLSIETKFLKGNEIEWEYKRNEDERRGSGIQWKNSADIRH